MDITDNDTIVPVDTDPADILVNIDSVNNDPIDTNLVDNDSLVAMEPVQEETIPEIPDTISEIISETPDTISEMIPEIPDTISQIISEAPDTISDIVPEHSDALPIKIDDVKSPMTKSISTVRDSTTMTTDPVDTATPTATPTSTPELAASTSTSTMLDTSPPTLSAESDTPESNGQPSRPETPRPNFYEVATIFLFSLSVILCYAYMRRLWIRRLSKMPWVVRLVGRRRGGPDDGLLALEVQDSGDPESFDGNSRQSESVCRIVLRFVVLAIDCILVGKLTRGHITACERRRHAQQQDGVPTDTVSVQTGSDVDVGILPLGVYAREEPRRQELMTTDPAKFGPKEADIAYHQAINDIRRVPRQPDNQPGNNADEPSNGISGTALGRPLMGSFKKLFSKEPGLPVQEVPRVHWPPRPRNDGGDQYNMSTRPEGEYRNVHYINTAPATVLQRPPERPMGLSPGGWPAPRNISQQGPRPGFQQSPQGLQKSPQQSPQQIYQQNPQQSPRRKPTPSDMTRNTARGPPSTLKQARRFSSGQGQGQGQGQGRTQKDDYFQTYPLQRVKNHQRHPTPTLVCRPDAQDEITVRSITVD